MKHLIWSSGHSLKFKDIVRADNCYLYTAKGKKLLDMESGVWCTSVGHNNQKVNNAIVLQLNSIMHTGFCYCNPVMDVAAKKVLQIAGLEQGKCEFLASGSEAVEYGMRIARSISEKPLALAFSDAYFGAYGDASVKNSNHWHVYDWQNCNCNNAEKSCTGECEDFDKIPFNKIGVFLFEPGSSSGMVRFPNQKLINKIVAKIKAQHGLVMCNEITTGTGRTGKWFGYQHYDFVPDIIAIGKGIGNGYPVSIVAISQKVADQLLTTNFRYAQSHQNDPLGAVVVAEVINIIESEQLLKRSTELGKHFMEELNQLAQSCNIIEAIRGRGLMLAIALKSNSQQVYEALLKKGFVVGKRPNAELLRLDPALTIGKHDIDNFLVALREIIVHQTSRT